MMYNLPALVPGKRPEETTVVVAMSGGVDSSCVAALCRRAGYNVIGITLQLWDYQGGTDNSGKKLGTCCALDDVYDARLVCKTIGIPHHTLKIESAFKEAVIDDFVETYLAGATPIPCVRCNQRIKFDNLLNTARELGADVLVTGHYAQKDWADGVPVIKRAANAAKDQTYYLFTTTPAQLAFLNFPLGYIEDKEVTRQLAQELGLHVAHKPDSQDICFVPGRDYRQVVKKFAPESERPGNIVRADGTVVGRHDGIAGYTVGQRKGLGGGTTTPMYVTAIRPVENEVVIGPKTDLSQSRMTVKDVNWLGQNEPDSLSVYVKVRAQHEATPATLKSIGTGRLEVAFHEAVYQISPGQAAVFYTPAGVMLGGGWIENPQLGKNRLAAMAEVKVSIQPVAS
jgi:tRNA-specific 2-thiouridylase